ncbi:hypothetical protein EXIGLDRAFT_51189 [Exidia glandulosa HHB12029]|uniref:Protein kinase domain-containing protein n=1 Tax=Exidia glandulosa HHB12029 TaxID=1314781 RepID=A0A165IED7_EXIGL|nr:hypothetical protein EXIGLDRAFT_51189 [Exidia glandulosa HHB12029]
MSQTVPQDEQTFPFALPSSQDGVKLLVKQLADWANASAKQDLCNVIFQLDKSSTGNHIQHVPFPLPEQDSHPRVNFGGGFIASPWDNCRNGCPHFPDRPLRQRPAVFDAAKTTLTLTKGLRVAQMTPSQIYRAQLAAGTSSVEVVAKIYQISRAGDRDELFVLLSEALSKRRNWANHIQGFRCEAYAYEKLKKLQGSHVPYVYGFFKIELPHKEPSVVMVAEYIKGRPLSELHGSTLSREQLVAIGTGIAGFTHSIAMCGILTQDFTRANFMIQPDYMVVGIDFGRIALACKQHRAITLSV